MADARTGPQLASAFVRVSLLGPRALVTWTVMGLVVVIFGITQHEIIGAVTVVVLGITLFGGLLTIRTRLTFAKAFAPGSVHTTSFGPDSMKVTGPLGSSEFRYAGYQIVWTGKAAVVLRRRDPAILMVFPAVLFPPAAVAYVRAQ